MTRFSTTYDSVYVVSSFFISLAASYVAISLCEQLRMYKLSGVKEELSFQKRALFLVSLALSLGGVAVWSMHLIGIYAIKIEVVVEILFLYGIKSVYQSHH